MFGVGAATRIYVATGATDLRKGFDGLYGLVRDRLLCNPMSGHIFLFSNSQRNRVKILYADETGLWVCAKRIEKGRVQDSAATKIVLSHEEMALLLGGIDLERTKRRRWYRKAS